MRQLKIERSITNRQNESLDKYLLEIGRIPMANIDEEEELAMKIQKGGREGERAKDKLIRANLRFVVSVAKQYQHKDSRCPTSSTRATSDWSRRPRSSIRHEASNSYLTRCGGYVRAFCRPSPNKAE